MIWRAKIRQWLRMAIVIAVAGGVLWAVAGGVLWVALKHAERAGGPSPAASLGEAMSKAARQRELTP